MSNSVQPLVRLALRRTLSLTALGAGLASSVGAQGVQHAGLQHAAQGVAQVGLQPAGLVVSNTGSSGLDGVRIDLGVAQGISVHHDFVSAPGGAFELSGTVNVPSLPTPVTVGGKYIISHAAGMACNHDFPTATYRVFNGGVLVFEEGDIPTGTAVTLDSAAVPVRSSLSAEGACTFRSELLQPVPMTSYGGVVVIGDAFELVSQGPECAGLLALDVLATDLPSFTLTTEELLFHGLPLAAAGDATLSPDGPRIVVQNIGSLGLDGGFVRYPATLPSRSFAMVEWEDPGAGAPLAPGAELRIVARGALGGASSVPLGAMQVSEGAGGVKEISADYTPLGSSTFRVEVLHAGQRMALAQGHTGPIASVDAWPSGCQVDTAWGATGLPGCAAVWPSATSITVPGLGTFAGDELRVLAEGGATVSAIAQLDVFARDLPQLALTGARSTRPDACLGFNYCATNPNSTGHSARICARGSANVADQDLRLCASDLPPNAFAFFLASSGQVFVAHPGGSAGNLCVGPSIGRGPGGIFNSGAAGEGCRTVDLNALPQPNGPVAVQAGETWSFQCWHRDAAPGGGSTSNFSDAVSVTFH